MGLHAIQRKRLLGLFSYRNILHGYNNGQRSVGWTEGRSLRLRKHTEGQRNCSNRSDIYYIESIHRRNQRLSFQRIHEDLLDLWFSSVFESSHDGYLGRRHLLLQPASLLQLIQPRLGRRVDSQRENGHRTVPERYLNARGRLY